MGDLETYFSFRKSGLELVVLAVGSVDDLYARVVLHVLMLRSRLGCIMCISGRRV